MTQLLGFDSDTRMAMPSAVDFGFGSTRTSADQVVFRHLARSLLACPGSRALRQRVTDRLQRAREPSSYIDELLDLCTTAGGTDRLDVAIDVLAATGDHVLRYAWDYLIRDLQRWNPYSDRAYEPNDDYWYILLKAVARCETPPEERVRFILACSGAATRGVLEGVVEALGDVRTNESRRKLGELSARHADPFIRKLASDVLNDEE